VFRQIRKLPPAHYLVHEGGDPEIRPYWRISFKDANYGRPVGVLLEELGALLQDAVRIRMISDVPLGAFLSGGLDSSGVVGTMARISGRPVKTFTIGFEDTAYSEVVDARRIAKHFGTDHEEFIVRPDAVDVLPKIAWHLDEPFGDSSALPTYYVAQMASRRVKVVLSGDGGDELFAGYRRYLDAIAGSQWSVIPRWVRKGILAPAARLLPLGTPGKNFLYSLGHLEPSAPGYRLGIYPYVKEELYRADFREEVQRHNPFWLTDRSLEESRRLDSVSRLQYLDIQDYLHNDILVKVDRMSMAHSIEIRSPLLDYRLMEFVANLPPTLRIEGTTTKVIFRKYLEGVLPGESFLKPKQGFGIPAERWFREDLNRFARQVLFDPGCLWKSYLRTNVFERMFRDHEWNVRDYSVWIWCLMIFELWNRQFPDAARNASGKAA
jgi:asparagine synthase (glutamine-hydrolysing)